MVRVFKADWRKLAKTTQPIVIIFCTGLRDTLHNHIKNVEQILPKSLYCFFGKKSLPKFNIYFFFPSLKF